MAGAVAGGVADAVALAGGTLGLVVGFLRSSLTVFLTAFLTASRSWARMAALTSARLDPVVLLGLGDGGGDGVVALAGDGVVVHARRLSAEERRGANSDGGGGDSGNAHDRATGDADRYLMFLSLEVVRSTTLYRRDAKSS